MTKKQLLMNIASGLRALVPDIDSFVDGDEDPNVPESTLNAVATLAMLEEAGSDGTITALAEKFSDLANTIPGGE